MRDRRGRIALGLLVTAHVIFGLCGLLAPSDPAPQDREFPYQKPSWVSLRLFKQGRVFTYASQHEFLLGSDALGRDQLSRLLYGGRVSLFLGLTAAVLACGLGLMGGMLAGFYAGWVDALIMRSTEVTLSLPWIYLLLTIRAVLPLHMSTEVMLILLVLILGVLGSARPARVLRGAVLAAKERGHVLTARGFGAGDWYLMRVHILPHLTPVILTQLVMLAPRFILAEVTLSFLGLGVSEPAPTWGNMLSAMKQYDVLTSYYWIGLPAIVSLCCVLFCYFLLADALQQEVFH